MRVLWLAAPLLVSALLALALAPASEAHADGYVAPLEEEGLPAGHLDSQQQPPPTDQYVLPNWQFVPSGLGQGDKFRLLFVTNETTTLTKPTFSYRFFDDYVRAAISSGGSDAIKPYANAFSVLASCGNVGAQDHTSTTYTRDDPGVPIYWLGGAKAADDYPDFYDGWDSNDPRNERGQSVGQRQVWTGSTTGGTVHESLNSNMSVCTSHYGVAFGIPARQSSELHYFVGSKLQARSMYGLSAAFVVSVEPSPPGMPEVVSTTHDSATVRWSAPVFHGGTPIFDYNMHVKRAGGSWTGATPDPNGTRTSHTITGLSPDTEYQVRVFAKNHGAGGSDTGYSPVSPVTTFHTKALVPSAPGKPTVVSTTNDSATIRWSAPTTQGATPIFDYNMHVKRAGGSWTGATPDPNGTRTSHTITGLSPDTEYQVRVFAKNHGAGGSDTGYSPVSPVTTFHTKALVPSIPGKPTVVPHETTAVVSWTAPAWPGSPPLNDYDMTIRPATQGVNVGVHGTGTTFTITGLNPDTTYQVQVRANNSVGHSSWSPVATFHTALARTVPADWALVPSGLGSEDRFRLLFATSAMRNAVPTTLSPYNQFVQAQAQEGHTAIRQFSGDFQALASVYKTNALTNTHTNHSSANPGVPIYWLGGAKVADDYVDFYDGCWDSNEPRDEDGNTVTGKAWTGSRADGTAWIYRELGILFSVLGNPTVQCKEIDSASKVSSSSEYREREWRMYGLSPIFIVR